MIAKLSVMGNSQHLSFLKIFIIGALTHVLILINTQNPTDDGKAPSPLGI